MPTSFSFRAAPAALVAAAALSFAPGAQAVEPAEFSVVGSWSSLPLHKQFERPFWTETLVSASGDVFSVEMTTFDQMGVNGGDVFRLLGDGVFDVGITIADYTVGDAPELEGLDVPLIAKEPDAALEMVKAARPLVEDIMAERFNSKLLAIAPFPPQIVFCNAEIASLADLKGLKIRGSGRMTTKFLDALGAEGVNISFSEVPGSLQRGVVDCAITGSGSGYNAGWHEVTTHLMTLPLGGWDPVVTAMNLDRWNALPTETQELIQGEIASKFETPVWAESPASLAVDVACLTGSGDCPLGDPGSMVLVEATAEDTALATQVLVEQVLPEWSERAGPEWTKRWNESVGALTGVSIE